MTKKKITFQNYQKSYNGSTGKIIITGDVTDNN